MVKLKNIFYGTVIAGLGMTNMSACASKDKEPKEDEKQTTEVPTTTIENVANCNEALFESCRNDIKFALAFVENHYDYIYWCGEAWTTADGLTILYNADGTYTSVTQNTKVPTHDEADIYKDRYLTFEVLPDIKNCITVPMDKNTLIAACVLRYCIGGTAFKKSNFVKYVNAGVKDAELAKTLTGYRKQKGILNRCYFFAAILADEMQFSDLLDLRAEGCYNFNWWETVVLCKDKKGVCIKKRNPNTKKLEYVPTIDKDGFCTWNFSDLDAKLQKAKEPKSTKLHLDKKKHGKTVNVQCELVKDIVPDSVWQDVSKKAGQVKSDTINFADVSADMLNDSSLAKEKLAKAKQKRRQNRRKTAFVIGAGIVAGGLLGRKRFIMRQKQQYQKSIPQTAQKKAVFLSIFFTIFIINYEFKESLLLCDFYTNVCLGIIPEMPFLHNSV